ncbi:MAG TPA: hypothetical protein VGI47_10520 [Candidatus Binataceae bacterium]
MATPIGRSHEPQAPSPALLIDRRRYAIDDLQRARGRSLIADCQIQLAKTGACLLPAFLTDAATARMAEEARAVAHLANHERSRGTAYLTAPDPTFPEKHPRRHLMTSSVRAVAYDLVPCGSAVRDLYEWDGLLDFIARVVGYHRIYRYADPLGALNIAVMSADDHLLWHFDQTDFVISILLQGSESGGAFEYVPFIRDADNPNYDRIARLFGGDRSEVIKLDLQPGMFVFFQGRNSIHRVTPVRGCVDRLIALLGYDTKPGTMSSDDLKMSRYGRAR